MNRTTLFAYLRRAPFGGRLTTAQVRGVEAILAACEAFAVTDLRWIAYILATAFHETAATMLPVRETLASSDARAIAILDKAFAAGKLKAVKTAYWRRDRDGKSWLGRGFVQLTHKRNYEAASALTGVDLVADPARAMDMAIAARILVGGMVEGLFTTRKLSHYFGVSVDDPMEARRIVNGTDKAKLIASYHAAILDALKAASAETEATDATAALAAPDDTPPAKSGSAIVAVAGPAVTGVALPLLGGINNLYALLFSLALLGMAAGAAYMFFSGRWSIGRGGAA